MGELGGQLPPPQFNKTRKFSEEVENFEGGIETAVKKRVAVEKERVSTLNEQKKCSCSFCSVFLSFYALTFLSKREESCWVQVAYSIDISERRLSVIGRGVLSQCKGWNFQNFPWDASYETNDPRIVKFSMSMFGAGTNWMVRSVLRQSRGSLRKICLRSSN